MAEKVIKAEELIEKDVFLDARKSAEQTIPVMRELVDIFKLFLQTTKETAKETKTNSGEGIEKLTRLTNEATQAANALTKTQNDLIKAEATLAASYDATTGEINANKIKLAELNLEKQEANKLAKQTAILNKAEEGSLEQLRVKLSQATKELDKMSAATLKTAAGLAQIEKVKNVSAAISEVEQASGRFQRNVGNYKSGYDGLAASINQLTREAPAAAISMNTFFMAISNNIPALVDQINQIKKANVELAESGKPTISVLGKIASAFFSWQTLISTGITLLTVYGGRLVDYISGTEKATEKQLDFNKALADGNKELKGLADNLEDVRINALEETGFITKSEAEKLRIKNDYNKKIEKAKEDTNANLKKLDADYYAAHGKDEKLDLAAYNKYLSDRNILIKNRNLELSIIDEEYRLKKIIADARAKKDAENAAKKGKDKAVKEKKTENEKDGIYDSAVLRDSNYKQELEYQEDFYKKEQINNDNAYTNNEIDYNQYQYNKTKIEAKWNQTRLDLAIKYEQDTLDIQKQGADEKAKEKKKADDDWSKEQDEFIKAVVNSWDDEEKKRKAKLAAATKERIEREKQLFDALEQISNTRYANEEKRLDRTIANSQRQQQTLALLAQNGVDNAKESLAAEQKIQADAEAKRAELQKKKERTEFAMTVLKMTTANLEANQGDPAKALIDTGVQVGALIALIQGLPSFFVGTEDTGSGGGLDGKGGFLSVLHPNERVMTAEQNAMIGDISNKEAAKVLSMYNAGLMPQVAYMPNYNSTQSSDVVKELREVKDAIKQIEIPVQSWAYDATEKAIIERVETRHKVITNHIKPKSGIWS